MARIKRTTKIVKETESTITEEPIVEENIKEAISKVEETIEMSQEELKKENKELQKTVEETVQIEQIHETENNLKENSQVVEETIKNVEEGVTPQVVENKKEETIQTTSIKDIIKNTRYTFGYEWNGMCFD